MSCLRLLTEGDLADAMALSIAARWNQVEADWLRMLHLEPEGCFAIEEDGQVVASAVALTYGRKLAWIGMVLTLPEYRGRGFASALMRHSLDWLDARGVECTKLDATDMGRPVYEKFGFVEEWPVERWAGEALFTGGSGQGHDRALDLEAFGADRWPLLELVGTHRPGRVAQFVGPIVARNAGEARELILATGLTGRTFWDLPTVNDAAMNLAREFGFEPARRLWRMRRGPAIDERPEFVYALAGFEYG